MKRVLVVPWSTAPTKSAMKVSPFLSFGGSGVLERRVARNATRLGLLGGQETGDQGLVQPGAEDAADDRADDGHPEVQTAVLVAEGGAVPGEERGEARAEVTCRVDGVAGVGPPGHADRDDDEADDERSEVGGGRGVLQVGHGEDQEEQDRGAD